MAVAELLDGELPGDTPVGADFEAAIGRLTKELDGLVGPELGDAVVRVAQLRSMLEAAEIDLAGRFDRSLEWSRDGYKHPTSWVRTECRLPRAVAGRRVGLSRKLDSMPLHPGCVQRRPHRHRACGSAGPGQLPRTG